MNLSDSDKHARADAITLLIDHASTLQDAADKAIDGVATAQAALSALPLQVEEAVEATVRVALAQPAQEASARMSEQLEAAIQAAAVAAERMTQLQHSINLRLTLWFMGLASLAAALVGTTAWGMGITPWQLSDRRAEVEAARVTLDRLRAAGAEADVEECIDRRHRPHLCVRVDPQYGPFSQDFWVLKSRGN